MKTFYVIHNSYQNGSWRGIEKCYVGGRNAVATLFETYEDADRALEGVPSKGLWEIWPLEVEVPHIRTKRRNDNVKVIEAGDRWVVVKDDKYVGAVFQIDGQWVYQSPDGAFWTPESNPLASREEAIERLLEEWS